MNEELKRIYEELEETINQLEGLCLNQELLILDQLKKENNNENVRTLNEAHELTHKATRELAFAKAHIYEAKGNL